MLVDSYFFFFFFFNDTATTEIYTLSLHDALPISVSDKLLDLVGLGGKSAADKGKDTRDYLAAAFPELNAWERAGADASSAGMVDAGFENHEYPLDRKTGSAGMPRPISYAVFSFKP